MNPTVPSGKETWERGKKPYRTQAGRPGTHGGEGPAAWRDKFDGVVPVGELEVGGEMISKGEKGC